MRQDRFDRDMARLEAARQRTQNALEEQQRRLDERFARMQERLERKAGKNSDSQQRIIDAALDLLYEDGLANITLRKLAARLDMQAPALYWYFKNKEELVDHMAEAILEKEFASLEPRRDDETWQDWLRNHMVRLRQAMLAYPDGARVVAGAHLYPAVTLAKSLECGLISLTNAGLSLTVARQIMLTATTYTFGYVIEEQAAPTEEQMAQFDLGEFLAPYPHMAQALGEEDWDRSKAAQEREYLSGLSYIIRGAEQD